MPLLTWSSSFLTSVLPLLMLFPVYQILKEELYLCLKYMNYLSRFMAFWTMLCPHESTCILAHVFNSASRQHCKVWASQFPFLHGLKCCITFYQLTSILVTSLLNAIAKVWVIIEILHWYCIRKFLHFL